MAADLLAALGLPAAATLQRLGMTRNRAQFLNLLGQENLRMWQPKAWRHFQFRPSPHSDRTNIDRGRARRVA